MYPDFWPWLHDHVAVIDQSGVLLPHGRIRRLTHGFDFLLVITTFGDPQNPTTRATMEAGATQSADINPNVAEPQLSEHSKSEEKNKLEPEENEIIAELTQQIANGPKDPNYERLKGWRLWSTTLLYVKPTGVFTNTS